MGVDIEKYVETDGKLYVYALNGMGDVYTVVLSENDGAYKFDCVLLPTTEWTGGVFQESMTARHESYELIQEELNKEVAVGCISLQNQVIPRGLWEDAAEAFGFDAEFAKESAPNEGKLNADRE